MGKFVRWCGDHKKEILIGAAITATVVIGGTVAYQAIKNNSKTMVRIVEVVSKGVEPPTMKRIDVPGYPRRLAPNCCRSAGRLEKAAQFGVTLAENQTWVDPYNYLKAVA